MSAFNGPMVYNKKLCLHVVIFGNTPYTCRMIQFETGEALVQGYALLCKEHRVAHVVYEGEKSPIMSWLMGKYILLR